MAKTKDCDIITWSKNLGFCVENDNFIDNSKKLVNPVIKSNWRHIIKAIKPRNEVAIIKKQLLNYNLQTQSGSTISQKVKNINDSKLYKQYKIFKNQIAVLDDKINENNVYNKSLKDVITSNEQNKKNVEKEEEDFKKLEVIKFYCNSLKMQNDNVQQVQNLIEKSFEDEPVTHSIHSNKIDNFWSSLNKSNEIENITQILRDYTKIPLPVINFNIDFTIIQEMDKIQKQKDSSNKLLEANLLQVENELELSRNRLVAKAQQEKVDESFFELWKKLLDAKLENLKQQVAQDMIKSFLSSKSGNIEVFFNDQEEKILQLQMKLYSTIEKIKFYSNNYTYINKYVQEEVDILKIDGLNIPDIEELKNTVLNIKEILREKKKNVLLLNLNSFNTLFNLNSKMASKKLFTINSFEKRLSDVNFDIEDLKDIDSSAIIENIIAQENENPVNVARALEKLRLQLKIINGKISEDSVALDFWMNPPVFDYLPNADQFKQIRERYQSALADKKNINL